VVDTFLLGLRGMSHMIKPKSKPKLSKEENLRKEHRKYLNKQGVPLEKEFRNMTYEERLAYGVKGAEVAGDMILTGLEANPKGMLIKGARVGLAIARNPKMLKKLAGKVVKKLTKKKTKTKKKKPSSAQKDYKQQSSLQRESGTGSTSRIGKMSPKGKFTPKKKPKRLN